MKHIYTILITLFSLLSVGQVSFSQIPNTLHGTFSVVESTPETPIESLEINKDKIESKVGTNIVQRLFYNGKENDLVLLEEVKLQITSLSQMPENRVPKLLKVGVETLENGQTRLIVENVRGNIQTMIIQKNQ